MSTRTTYGVTPSQRLSFLNRQWTIHKAIVNIPTSLVVKGAHLDRALFEDALRRCIQRWDAFGLRFVKEGKEIKQYFGDRDCLYLEHKDFTDADELERYFLARAKKPIPRLESPQSGFVIFTTPEGDTGLFSVFNHLIMDSWAISMFYTDVIEVYWALAHDEPLPKAPRDHEPVLKKELEYEESDRCQADREFWERELGTTQALFTSIRGGKVLEAYRRKIRNTEARQCSTVYLRTKADHVVLTVAREDIELFSGLVSGHRGFSLQLLFLFALRMYLAKVNGRSPDVSLGSNVARRATLEEKFSGGSRVQHLFFRTIMTEDMTFLEAIETMLAKQNLYFKHVDFSSYETQFMAHKFFAAQGSKPGTGYYDVHMTFQPLPMTFGHGLTAVTNWYCNGATSLPSYLTVMDDDGSGGLRCYWERNVRHVPVEVIQDCHRFMVTAMRAVSERPTITLGEIMDL